MITTKQEILEHLTMPENEFKATVMSEAKKVYARSGNRIIITAMLGYSNICRNQCAYCGMRAENKKIRRYRLSLTDIKNTIEAAAASGFERLFLISGEDPDYRLDNLLEIIVHGKKHGLFLSLAAGEMPYEYYDAFEDAGLDEYVLKFETTDRNLFGKIKPTGSFDGRMKCIEYIANSRMKLASGNITGLPGQSLDSIADDILIMKELNISWAPVVPYMPVPGTPLAQNNSRGSLEIILKEISILRLMLPEVNITAQQPGEEIKNGFGDIDGNLNALKAGANMLFTDLLPVALAGEFKVIDNRNVEGIERIVELADLSAMKV